MTEPTPTIQTDGTRQLRDSSFGRMLERLASSLPVVSGVHGWVDEYTAAQLGLVLVVNTVRWRSVDLLALASGRVERSKDLEVQRVYLDYPDADATDPPTPFAVVTEAADGTYEPYTAMVSVGVLEDTLHRWGFNTVLRLHGRAMFEFAVQVFTSHKDDRAGLRKRLVEVFVTEPDSDATGRRIVLPFYFDQPVRYTLVSVSYPDDGEMAQANRWPLIVRLRAELQHVTLVEAPGAIRVPVPAVQVDEPA